MWVTVCSSCESFWSEIEGKTNQQLVFKKLFTVKHEVNFVTIRIMWWNYVGFRRLSECFQWSMLQPEVRALSSFSSPQPEQWIKPQATTRTGLYLQTLKMFVCTDLICSQSHLMFYPSVPFPCFLSFCPSLTFQVSRVYQSLPVICLHTGSISLWFII